MIQLQALRMRWTKQSRGADAHRPRLTEALVFPPFDEPIAPYDIVSQRVDFDEANAFALSRVALDRYDLVPRRLYERFGLRIRIGHEPDTLELGFHWNVEVGAPTRTSRTFGTLTKGQWARLEHNGRSGHGDEWSYTQTIVNVGFFETISPEAFVNTNPTLTHSELADLW